MKFTKDHEWVEVEGDIATIGISIYAAEQLGDIVYVEVPEEGKDLMKGDEACVVESVKAASEVYSPLSGVVTAFNKVLEDMPETVNQDAQGEGWFFKLTMTNPSEYDEMMDADAYKTYLDSLE